MKKKLLASILALSVALSLISCGQKQNPSKSDPENAESTKETDTDSSDKNTDSGTAESTDHKSDSAGQRGQETSQTEQKKTEIQVFIDSDLEYVMNKVAESYEANHPEVEITYNVDHSATLLTQIEEGSACDLYFSGIESQMESLRNSGWIISDGYTNVVGGSLVVISKKGSGTTVTGLGDFAGAKSIAMASGGLPVGVYTRRAMVVSGLIMETDDLSTISSAEISEQLNGAIIQEKDSVPQVIAAVTDGSCEVGCVLYSDICGYEDLLDVVETLGNDYSGRIVYPLAQIKNDKAGAEETAAATAFMEYINSQEAAAIFNQCHFSAVQ